MAIKGQISSVVCAAPYSAQPKGFQQLSVTNTATGLTVPTGATFALITVDTKLR